MQAQTLFTRTATINGSTSDGYMQRLLTAYVGARTFANAEFKYAAGDELGLGQHTPDLVGYTINRTYLYFDTGTITDEVVSITNVELSLYCISHVVVQAWNITIEEGSSGSPHDPLQISDYNYLLYSGDGGNLSASLLNDAQYNNITFTVEGLTWIDLVGTTELCLRSTRDVIGNDPIVGEREWARFYAAEKGASFGPVLYVTYTVYGVTAYMFYGPYYEDGTVASTDTVTVTAYQSYGIPETFSLPQGNGSAWYELSLISTMTFFAYNISDVSYNYSRSYFCESSETEFYVFIPKVSEHLESPTLVTLIDLAGIDESSYLSTVIPINGTYRTVEKQKANVYNPMQYWLIWGNHYNWKLTCNFGIYYEYDYTATSTYEKKMIVLRDMFPIASEDYPLSVTAERNETYIEVNFTNSEATTIWVYWDISKLVNDAWTSVTSQNDTSNSTSLQFTWANAVNTTDYRVTVIANIASTLYTWMIDLEAPVVPTNPWTDTLNGLGTWPVPSEYIFGFLFVLVTFGCCTYIDLGLGCTMACVMASFLVYINWLPGGTANFILLGVAWFIAIGVDLKEAKKVEREI